MAYILAINLPRLGCFDNAFSVLNDGENFVFMLASGVLNLWVLFTFSITARHPEVVIL